MYDFITVPDRSKQGSFKWDGMKKANPKVKENVVPLSVADMEFKMAPEIIDGLKKYLDTMILGYTGPTDGYYNAVINWMKKHHELDIKKEWITLSDGVVPAIVDLISVYSNEGDGVMITSPVYYPFKASIENTNRKVIDVPLILNGNKYEMDYDVIEKQAKNAKLFILCNPHNPVGRVWTREELTKLYDILVRNDVYIIDDEIHNDLIMPGFKHTCLGTIAPDALMHMTICTAPSKSFNLAGMQTSNLIIADENRKKAYEDRRFKTAHMSLNSLGYEACRIVYTECEKWLEEVISVIDENAKYMTRFLAENFPEVKVFPLEGTYLLWADFNAWGMSYEELEKFMINDAELFLDEGYVFGKGGEGFERFNLACPKSVIEDACKRLLEARNKNVSNKNKC